MSLRYDGANRNGNDDIFRMLPEGHMAIWLETFAAAQPTGKEELCFDLLTVSNAKRDCNLLRRYAGNVNSLVRFEAGSCLRHTAGAYFPSLTASSTNALSGSAFAFALVFGFDILRFLSLMTTGDFLKNRESKSA